MAIDSFIEKRQSKKSKKKDLPSKNNKVLQALSAVEKFILLDHIKEGRFGLALAGISARIFGGMLFRKGVTRPDKKSLLELRRSRKKVRRNRVSSVSKFQRRSKKIRKTRENRRGHLSV